VQGQVNHQNVCLVFDDQRLNIGSIGSLSDNAKSVDALEKPAHASTDNGMIFCKNNANHFSGGLRF
jgi:hypothetical protein